MAFLPIVLTATGATLASLNEKNTENSPVSIGGLHVHCGGYFQLYPESETYNRLVCKSCFLAVSILRSIKWMNELRLYFKDYNKQTIPPAPSTQKEDADGALVPHRHARPKECYPFDDGRCV